MVDFTTPTRAQIAKLAGNDQRLILAVESLFSIASENEEIQENINTLQEGVAANVASIEGNATGISANSVEIAVNALGIEENAYNAALNAVDIAALQVAVAKVSPDKFKFIQSVSDLPDAAIGVITLAADTTYFFTDTVDLAGARLVGAANTVLTGGSSENAKVISTGLDASSAIFTTTETTPIRHISFEHGTIFDIDGGGTAALDWLGVNFINSPNVGTIQNVSNFVSASLAFLGSEGLVIDGTHGTVSFRDSLFQSSGSGSSIRIAATAVISRRYREVDCAHVSFGASIGIEVEAGASIPVESFILEGVNFSGGATYLSGVDETSPISLFRSCSGIANTANVAEYYMNGNAVETVIATASVPVKVEGVTTAATINQGFSHADNRLTYGREIGRYVRVSALLSYTGSSNRDYAFYIALNGAAVASSRAVSTSGSGGAGQNVSTQAILELGVGDFIEVWSENQTNSNNLTVTDLDLIAEALG